MATDFIQLPPERIGTLSRPDDNHVPVSITGVTAVTNAPGVHGARHPGPTSPNSSRRCC